MAVYKPPKVLPYQQKLPRMTLPGQQPADDSIAPFLKRLPPQMSGTDTYQAGQDQSVAGEMKQAYGDYSKGMSQQESALREQQQAAVKGHQEYMSKLQAAQDQVNTRDNDLKLSKNFLIATDPTMDKSVRKFFLQGLSQASGVDPKGEYSKSLQGMVLGMDPPNLEALRGAFAKDIRESPPGAIQKQLNGLFSGAIPIENVMARVQAHQAQMAAVGAAATDPSRIEQPGTLAGGVVAGAASPTAAPAPAVAPSVGSGTPALAAEAPTVAGGQPQPTAAPATTQAAPEMASSPDAVAPPTAEAPPPAPPVPPVPDIGPSMEASQPPVIPTTTEGPTPAPTPTPAPAAPVVPEAPPTPAIAPTTAAAPEPLAPEQPRDPMTGLPLSTPPPTAPSAAAGAVAPGAKTTTPAPPPAQPEKFGPYTIQPTPKTIETPKPPAGPSSTERLHSKIQAQNEKIDKVPPVDTSKLYPVDISKLPEGDKPLTIAAQGEIPNLEQDVTYTGNQVKQISKPPSGEAAQNKWADNIGDARENSIKVNTSAANIVDLTSGNPKLVGGISVALPWKGGGQADLTPGGWKGTSERMEAFLDGIGIGRDTVNQFLNNTKRMADDAAAKNGIAKDTREYTILYSELLGMGNSIARLQNPGRAPTDNDFRNAIREVGELTLTPANLVASVTNVAQRYSQRADSETAKLHQNPDVLVNLDKIPRADRDTLLSKDEAVKQRTGNGFLTDEWRTRLQHSNDKEDGKVPPEPTLKRAGVTIEQRTEVQQREAGEHSTREQSKEARAQEEARQRKEHFEKGSPFEQQKRQDVLAHQAAVMAQHEKDKAEAAARHQQDKIAAAFKNFASAMAGAVKGISLPNVQLGGAEAPMPTLTMPQRRAPPAVPQLPLGRTTYPRLIK